MFNQATNLSGFSTALSGLRSQQAKLEVLSDNIANINTIGYKSSRMTFSDQYGQTIGTSYRAFHQGNFSSTGVTTDLAINGDSFFVVGKNNENFYSRAGAFFFDEDGWLVNTEGYNVQGYMANSQLLDDVYLDRTSSEPKATENVWLTGNLNAGLIRETEEWTSAGTMTLSIDNSTVPDDGTTELNDLAHTTTPLIDGDMINITGVDSAGNTVSASFTYGVDGTTMADLLTSINTAFSGHATATLQNGKFKLQALESGDNSISIRLAADSSNSGVISLPSFSPTTEGFTPTVQSSLVVYDNRGGPHNLTIEFEKTEDDGIWKTHITSSDDTVNIIDGEGEIRFDHNGNLIGLFSPNTVTLNMSNGDSVNVQVIAQGENGFSGISQFDSVSNFSIRAQDGRAEGLLKGYQIEGDGKIYGSYSNGEIRELAQIAVANFTNASGLVRSGQGLFSPSLDSGIAQVTTADRLGSTIQSGALELSNVDLADQFTQMIEAQRSYQAVSRVITTLDDVLNETSRLKR